VTLTDTGSFGRLRELDLSWNGISRIQISTGALPQLQRIILTGNPLDDQSIVMLQHMTDQRIQVDL
jgi:Leucine-rich repeat (LRR) protein